MLRLFFTLLLTTGAAHADPVAAAGSAATVASGADSEGEEESAFSRHAVFAGLGGKGGLYTAGYQFHLSELLAFGAGAGVYRIDYETLATFAPYASVRPLAGERHALFLDVGPIFGLRHSDEPVAVLDDEYDVGLAGQVSLGYEYKNTVVIRPYLMGAYGIGGASVWAGLEMGYTW